MARLEARRIVVFGAVVIWATLVGATPAGAGITVTGSTNPTYDSSDPWSPATDLVVGYQADGTVDVTAGSDIDVSDGNVLVGSLDPSYGSVSGTLNVSGAGSTVTVSDMLMVGPLAEGVMSVTGGGTVSSDETWIGGSFEVTGDLVTGVNAGTGEMTLVGDSLLDTGWLVVGLDGGGTLSLQDGADATTETGIIGVVPDAAGSVFVQGSSCLWDLGEEDLIVGAWGDGSLSITGGTVESYNGWIGGADANSFAPDPFFASYGDANGVGEVTVDGVDSEWSVEEILTVGAWGDGTLTVSGGGSVTTLDTYIGGFDPGTFTSLEEYFAPDAVLPDGRGAMTVTGSGSTATAEFVTVGFFGDGTLDVNDGGQFNAEAVEIGVGPDVTGTARVAGANSTLAIAEELVVGMWGEGELTVSQGGLVTMTDGYVGGIPFELLEEEYDPDLVPDGNGAVTVTGTNSAIDAAGTVYVGFFGDAALDVNDGGQFEVEQAAVGMAPGSTGAVTVDGPGSLLDVVDAAEPNEAEGFYPGVMVVGGYGRGTLDITNGGLVNVEDVLYVGGYEPNELPFDTAQVGHDPDGTGTVTVAGAGSILSADSLVIGTSGDGTLEITDDAEVYSDYTALGVAPGSHGEALIDNAPGTWENENSIFVGGWGEGELTVSNAGHVDIGDALFIGGFEPLIFFTEALPFDFDPNGTGTMVVTGAGSLVETGIGISVGHSGDGFMQISQGGQVTTLTGAIGAVSGATGEVSVDGVGSQWAMTDPMDAGADFLAVGLYGQGVMTVSGGGRVTNGDAYIGGIDTDELDGSYAGDLGTGSGTGNVLVTGTGSQWLNAGQLYVAYCGDANMAVLDGGEVTGEAAYVGYQSGATGNVTIEDENSAWQTQALFVGYGGDANLVIEEAGQLASLQSQIGYESTSTGAVTVRDPNSAWTDTGAIRVGVEGDGTLNVLNGAQVTSLDGALGGRIAGAPGTGQATVSGTGSAWGIANDLVVGEYGAATVTVSDGGQITSNAGYVGVHAGSDGNTVLTGPDSLWDVTGSLYVGGDGTAAGGTGVLRVSNGAEVAVGDALTIWETGTLAGDGTVTVSGAQPLRNYGAIAPGDSIGTLTVAGDVVFEPNSVYEVEIDNSSADKLLVDGDVTIDGGTVEVSSAGTVVGDHEYEIITANSVTGEFDALDTALLSFAFTEIGLDYNDISVWLHIAAANFDDPNIAQTYNQRQVAGALQEIASGGGNEVTEGLQEIDDLDDLRGAYDQLSGQTRPPLAPMTAASTSQFVGTVASRVQRVQTGLVGVFSDSGLWAMTGPDSGYGGRAYGYAPQGQSFAVGHGAATLGNRRWGLWGQGYGLYGDRESENDLAGYSYDAYGASLGLDYQFTETFLGGLVAGMSDGDVDFFASRDNTDFEARHVGLYGSFASGDWYLDSVLTYADLDYETERFVDATSERLTGDFGGYEFAAYMEGGRKYEITPRLQLQPLASVQYGCVNVDGYTESGGASALTYNDQSYESLKGSLGARLTRTLVESAGDFHADAQVRGRWVHEFGDTHSSVDAAFASAPGTVFTVRDKDVSRDSAVFGVGLSAEMNEQTRLHVDFDTRFSSDESVHVISAALQYRW